MNAAREPLDWMHAGPMSTYWVVARTDGRRLDRDGAWGSSHTSARYRSFAEALAAMCAMDPFDLDARLLQDGARFDSAW